MRYTFLTFGLVAAIMVGSSSGVVHHYIVNGGSNIDNSRINRISNDNLPKNVISGVRVANAEIRGGLDGFPKDAISGVSGANTENRGGLDFLLKDAISTVFGTNTGNRGNLFGGIASSVVPGDVKGNPAIQRRSLKFRRKQGYVPLQRRSEEEKGEADGDEENENEDEDETEEEDENEEEEADA